MLTPTLASFSSCNRGHIAREGTRPSPFALAFEFLLYALLTAFALHSTWLTWPDSYIDFSRELYIPWRLSCGDVLYRDPAFYYGPVSVYLNAALFRLLGCPSIRALFVLNFVLWLATLTALRSLLRRLACPAVATLAVSLFILLFSFNRYTGVGNYNFLAPYSHELPRGLLLTFLSLLSLDSALCPGRAGKPPPRSCALAVIAGFLLGLALFTKPELVLAAVASSAVLFLARIWKDAAPCRVLPGHGLSARDGDSEHSRLFLLQRVFPQFAFLFSLFCGGILAAVATVLIPLSLSLGSFRQALSDGLLRLFLDCLRPGIVSTPFFQTIRGTDNIPAHVLRMCCGAIIVSIPFSLSRFLLARIRSRPLLVVATAFLSLLSAAIGFSAFFSINAVLPLVPLALLVHMILRRRDRHSAPRKTGGAQAIIPSPRLSAPPLAVAFAVLALALTTKIFFNASMAHYGFILALPAFCCAVLFAFRPPCPAPCAAVAAALFLGFSVAALRLQSDVLRSRDVRHPIHDSAYLAPPHEAQAFNGAADWIRANTPSNSTLAVFPEGAVLNVITRRPTSTPYVCFRPEDLLRYDSDAFSAAFLSSPPDTLVLVQTPPPRFGIDYATDFMAWLDPLYVPAATFTVPTPSGPLPFLLVATRSSLPP